MVVIDLMPRGNYVAVREALEIEHLAHVKLLFREAKSAQTIQKILQFMDKVHACNALPRWRCANPQL
ncbi:hypothetical protein L917_19059 [Phytophthora nicotianae]|uniref:Uncharacterized protein n=1 Tax=Phytophthora nicotianae TaxID=4792 RepID=W2K7B2_PHYNI|nr:hypothetical protein L917_19059 [Phytophthora nicotianae]